MTNPPSSVPDARYQVPVLVHHQAMDTATARTYHRYKVLSGTYVSGKSSLCIIFFFFGHHFYFQLNPQEVLPSATFWTSRGHRCLPFPPVRAFVFIAYRVQHPRLLVDFHRMLLTHVLALSASHFLRKKKSQRVQAGSSD